MSKFTLNLLPEGVSDDLLMTLGITADRGTKLKDISCDALDETRDEKHLSVAHVMKYIIERCDTMEEVAAGCFLFGRSVGMQDGMDSAVIADFLRFLKSQQDEDDEDEG